MKDDDENTTQAQYLVSSSYSESIESVMIEEFRTRLDYFDSLDPRQSTTTTKKLSFFAITLQKCKSFEMLLNFGFFNILFLF